MFTRKFLAISLGIAISIAGTAPAGYAKKGSGAATIHADSSTVRGASANAESSSDREEGETDDDLKEVASVVEKSDGLVSAGKYSAAIDVLRAGLKEHGQNPHLHDRLSKASYLNGSIDDAISELLVAISIDPNVFDYYSDVAWLYSVSGKYREAVTYSKAAVLHDPTKAYPYVVMGFSLGSLGKKQQATEMLKKAIELDANNSTAYLYLADVMANGGDFAHALPLYQKCLKLDSKTASAYVGLGDCFGKLGHAKEAIAAYKRAVDLSPQDPNARGHLGFALSQSGDYMGAMRQGMTANSIRLGQYWGKFMGMFVAVWAGIFLVFGTVFGAMFMGSRFIPVAGESILNQFVMVFYKERPGRFVITDKRIVFVPEIISRWFGATRVSIQRDQISSLKTESTASGGTVTINVTSESALVFRIPSLIFAPLVAVLNDQQLVGDDLIEETIEHVKVAAPLPTTRIPEKEEQSDTANFEKYAVIAASFDFRDGRPEEPTLKLTAIPQTPETKDEQAVSSTALFKGPKGPKQAVDADRQATAKSDAAKKESQSEKKEPEKSSKPALRPLAKLEPIPAVKPASKSDNDKESKQSKTDANADQSPAEKTQAQPQVEPGTPESATQKSDAEKKSADGKDSDDQSKKKN